MTEKEVLVAFVAFVKAKRVPQSFPVKNIRELAAFVEDFLAREHDQETLYV